MYKGRAKTDSNKLVTKEDVIREVTEEAMFLRYMGYYPNSADHYVNPFRVDDSPGCKFFRDKGTRRIKFCDYSLNKVYDCFDAAKEELSKTKNILSFQHLLECIMEDFKINTDKFKIRADLKVKKFDDVDYSFKLYHKKMEWTKHHINFWNNYYQSPDILQNKFKVYPISEGWLIDKEKNKEIQIHKHITTDIGFVFIFRNCSKFYFPNRKERRFYQDSSNYLQGYDQLDYSRKECIITKSYKDVICYQTFNINAVSTMSESILPTKKQIEWLQSKFDYLFIQVDFDRTGRRFARYINKNYGIPYLFFTHGELGLPKFNIGVKDFADHLKIEGIENTQKLINNVTGRFSKKRS